MPIYCALHGLLTDLDSKPLAEAEPLPGAVDFVMRLAQLSRVVVYFTSNNANLEAERQSVIDWLAKYGFPQVNVTVSAGPPTYSAVIDPLAVRCRPLDDPNDMAASFNLAIRSTELLVKMARARAPATNPSAIADMPPMSSSGPGPIPQPTDK